MIFGVQSTGKTSPSLFQWNYVLEEQGIKQILEETEKDRTCHQNQSTSKSFDENNCYLVITVSHLLTLNCMKSLINIQLIKS